MMADAAAMDAARDARVEQMNKEKEEDEKKDAEERAKRLKESSGFAGDSGKDAAFIKGIRTNIISGDSQTAADLIQRRRFMNQKKGGDFL